MPAHDDLPRADRAQLTPGGPKLHRAAADCLRRGAPRRRARPLPR